MGPYLKRKAVGGNCMSIFGTIKLSLRNMRDYEQGKIAYDEWMRRDIALWKPKPHITTIEKILLDYTLAPNAKHIIKTLRERKLHVAIVTTGIDILANSVAMKLHIPNVIANGLVLDENGYLTNARARFSLKAR